MKYVHYTYWGYSVAAFLVWGMIMVIFWALGNAATIHSLLLVFLGWAIAWSSTSIARIVYPPPKRWFNLKTQSWSTHRWERDVLEIGSSLNPSTMAIGHRNPMRFTKRRTLGPAIKTGPNKAD